MKYAGLTMSFVSFFYIMFSNHSFYFRIFKARDTFSLYKFEAEQVIK